VQFQLKEFPVSIFTQYVNQSPLSETSHLSPVRETSHQQDKPTKQHTNSYNTKQYTHHQHTTSTPLCKLKRIGKKKLRALTSAESALRVTKKQSSAPSESSDRPEASKATPSAYLNVQFWPKIRRFC
jgi:hypothetical protein